MLPVDVSKLVPKFAKLALPLTLNVPATFTPVPVTNIMFALPALENVMFPPDIGRFTLLVPLDIKEPDEIVVKFKLPAPSVDNN